MAIHEFNVSKNVNTAFLLPIPYFVAAGGSGHVARINDVFTTAIALPSFATTYAASSVPIAFASTVTVALPTKTYAPGTPVNTTADDCWGIGASSFSKALNYLTLGYDNDVETTNIVWIPFDCSSTGIAQGTTVLSAILTVYAADNYAEDEFFGVRLRCEASVNATVPTSYATLNGRGRTSNCNFYIVGEEGTTSNVWVADTGYAMPCTASVQEVINMSTWNPASATTSTLAVMISNETPSYDSIRNIRSFEYSSGTYCATLTIIT